MGLFRKNSRKLPDKVITLREAKNYMKKYTDYDFPPVYAEGKLIGYKPVLHQEVQKSIRKMNNSFYDSVVAQGQYKGIDVEVSKKYGNYEQTKGYQSYKNSGKEVNR